jgi:hypothetical protein
MLSTKVLLAAAAACFLVTLAVPTVALTIGEDAASDDVILEPVDDRYATIEDGELELDLNVYDDAVTTIVEVFTVEVGADADDVEAMWIEHDVEGVTFYANGSEVTNDSRLDLSAGDTETVGVVVDTHVAETATETFTVTVQYEDEGSNATGGAIPPRTSTIDGSNFEVSPTTVEAGETVTATATYRNVGSAPGTVTANLVVDGTVVDRQTIELEPGESRTVSFERAMDWPGTYEVGIEGAGSETVTVEGSALEVPNATVTDAELVAGESTTIEATVRNPTDRTVERTLELAIDGIVVESRAVSIPANGERTVTFERGFDEPGIYEVSISGVDAGTVTVGEPEGFEVRNRDLSAATTAALAPPATAGMVFLLLAANRRWAIVG